MIVDINVRSENIMEIFKNRKLVMAIVPFLMLNRSEKINEIYAGNLTYISLIYSYSLYWNFGQGSGPTCC